MKRNAPINLNLLHTFLLVADSASFRRAAERCFRSESAVSMQIRQLEEQLGVTLFQRTTRNVKLTEEGQRLALAARRGLDTILAGIRESQDAALRRNSQVTVVAAPTVAAALVPEVLTTFRVDQPGVLVTVRQTNLLHLTDMVRRGEADFGLGSCSLGLDGLDFEPLLKDELFPIFPVEQAKRYPRGITPEEFARCPLILNEKAVMIRQQLDEALAAHGIFVTARYQTLEFSTTLAMVASGLGVGIVPRMALLGSRAQVRSVPIVGIHLERDIGIITAKGKALAPAAAALLRCAREVLIARQHRNAPIEFADSPEWHRPGRPVRTKARTAREAPARAGRHRDRDRD